MIEKGKIESLNGNEVIIKLYALNLKQKDNNMKKILLTILVSVFLTATANAFEVPLFSGETNWMSDNSAGYLLNWTGTEYVNVDVDDGDTTVDEDDRIRGWFRVDTIEDRTGSGGEVQMATETFEVTGFYDVVVESKTWNGSNWIYQMGAYSGFATEIETNALLAAGDASGALVAFYTDDQTPFIRVDNPIINGSNPDLPDSSQEEAMVATAIDGELEWVFGETIGDEFWTVTIPTDDVSLLDDESGINVGTASFGFHEIINKTSYELAPDVNGFEMTGNGNFYAASITSSADLHDDVNFIIRPTVIPEPSTFLLLGLGLLGFAHIGRKKSS